MFDRSSQIFGQEVSKARSTRQTVARFWEYFREYRLAIFLIGCSIILSVALQVIAPFLVGEAADCYLVIDTDNFAESCRLFDTPLTSNADRMRGLGLLVLVVAGLYTFGSILGGTQFYSFARVGYRVLHAMRLDIFRHVHRLSLGYYSRNSSGDVMSRLTNDIDTIVQMIGFPLLSTVQSLLTVTLIIASMLYENVPYGLLSLAVLPITIMAIRWFSAQARKAFRVARKEIGEVNADLQENIAAVREVQAFSREDENIEMFREQNASNRDANVRAQVFSTALSPIAEALGYVNIALIVGIGGWALLNGGALFGSPVTAGTIITFLILSQRYQQPVQQVATLWANIQSALAGGERIFDFMDVEPEIADDANATTMPEINGHVLFSDVHMEYLPGEPVLRGVTVEAQPGQTIAIVGPTGAGKTSIINLLPRFYDVMQGEVKIDGINVQSVTRKSLRDQIGIVLQDTVLFSESVTNNIRYGRPDASDEEVIAAAKSARADGFIESLPDGYATVLGERGSGLSQGQRQLLAIARVILMNPRILILDEATSSVDTRTEREIQTALDTLLEGRTSFVVAHRLSTIRNADKVLVLKEGEIIESGTHDELLEQSGFYHGLYMSQFRRMEISE